MIAPLIPYGIKGTLWYQGENNVSRGAQYRTLLPLLIQDWRQRWGEGNFPFYIVQLANYNDAVAEPGESGRALVREAQLQAGEQLPNCGVAVTIDLGEAHNIHPVRKPEVGHRLALIALNRAYGIKQEDSGPIYNNMTVEGGQVRLTFQHLGGGLVAQGGPPLKEFAIAGADRKFVWADARIDGDTVVVSSASVPNPVAVRYAWADNPAGCNLYNAAGLPASPFRTDNW
jgi:sialate O-acetylesterase